MSIKLRPAVGCKVGEGSPTCQPNSSLVGQSRQYLLGRTAQRPLPPPIYRPNASTVGQGKGDLSGRTAQRPSPPPIYRPNSPIVRQSKQKPIGSSHALGSTAIFRLIQRAKVSGCENPNKSATQIGNDMHEIVQELFFDQYLTNSQQNTDLAVEHPVGTSRSDLVAFRKGDNYEDDQQDLLIEVGEIKPLSRRFQNIVGVETPGQQLARTMNAYKLKFPRAIVVPLTGWKPSKEGVGLPDGYTPGYLYVQKGPEKGLYYYSGRVNEKEFESDSSSDSEYDPYEITGVNG